MTNREAWIEVLKDVPTILAYYMIRLILPLLAISGVVYVLFHFIRKGW